VESHALGLANRLRAELGLPQQDSAIVSLPIVDAADKMNQADIRASVRAGAVRVGFHLYNTDDDLDRLLDALR
jgi:selenocysteine lyase/cysteine desulfurase